jgi:hypothetical protein
MRNRFTQNRIKSGLIRRLNQYGFLINIRQIENFGLSGKKLLIVASGSILIPGQGWGAVEKIIYETIDRYQNSDFIVTLLNSKHRKDWLKLSQMKFDVILCHDDASILKIKSFFPDVPLVVVTHYGSLANISEWDLSFRKTFETFKLADKIAALSPACSKVLQEAFPEKEIHLLPNGCNEEQYLQFEVRNRAIYLGKIEPRKRQSEIAKLFPELPIDFVGPGQLRNQDTDNFPNGARFLGERNREWLQRNLASYKVGILLSSCEADALVLYEYQNAGLQVIVSRPALGSQNDELPWIQVSTLKELPSNLLHALNSEINPKDISNHAKTNYTWDSRITGYQELLKDTCKRN